MRGTVLITGASAGIGFEAARHLAGAGWNVVATSRRSPDALPPGVRWLPMDVRDETSVREAIAAASPVDALVCNAGFGIFGSVEEVSIERARQQFDTNVFGTLHPIRAVLPQMRARRAGRIVVVGSLSGRAPIPFQLHYSMTKAALDALVQGLRLEVAPFGVQVALVEPGDIKTGFNDATDWGLPGPSAYGEAQRRCEAVIRASLVKAPGPMVVALAIERALGDADARVRYPAGPDSRVLPLARRWLPERWVLRLIGRHFGV
jgi:NAD(P)-dependent dehydrogenase (short-subunit alcohol dehydrogenase family)